MLIRFIAISLLVVCGLAISSEAGAKGSSAYYNNNSAPNLDVAAVDRLLARKSATEGFKTFVPSYPAPQQQYIRIPTQAAPAYAPQGYAQQYGTYYQPPAYSYSTGW